jgi:hypothetical protein
MRSRRLGLTALLVCVPVAIGCSVSDGKRPLPAPSDARLTHATTSPDKPPASPKATAPLASPALRKYCHPGDPLVGVYSPLRLTVKNPCVSVPGVVLSVTQEHDDDQHIRLGEVDPKWLNEVNISRARGSLVVEIVPYIPVAIPPIGARITVIGPWVLDTETGWLEVHPVWQIVPTTA